jgi:hypothetical protein
MAVKIWTDCAGDGMAFARRVRKRALTWATETGMKVWNVRGVVDGMGEGA